MRPIWLHRARQSASEGTVGHIRSRGEFHEAAKRQKRSRKTALRQGSGHSEAAKQQKRSGKAANTGKPGAVKMARLNPKPTRGWRSRQTAPSARFGRARRCKAGERVFRTGLCKRLGSDSDPRAVPEERWPDCAAPKHCIIQIAEPRAEPGKIWRCFVKFTARVDFY